MSKRVREPLPPSTAAVKDCLHEWQTLEKYVLQEASLALLFQKLCPGHDEVSHVLLKVSALNDFYSTNIFDTHSVAKHIVASDVTDRIVSGDTGVVNELALVTFGRKKINFYSFATKYCSHHNAEKFPIYDANVEKMLMHFCRTDRFATFHKEDLKKYSNFVEIIGIFRRHYNLEQFSLRQIDIYLWIAGKAAFPRKKAIRPSRI